MVYYFCIDELDFFRLVEIIEDDVYLIYVEFNGIDLNDYKVEYEKYKSILFIEYL